jgi:prepilin signal peptidase PulO-like enzyme (type II secretory pathway)
LGLCAGSFVNALVWRIHQQSKGKKKLSIINGRSICPNCRHKLAWYDLIPVISWLMLQAKCRYCNKPIKDSPLIELCAGVVFVASYIFWPSTVNLNGQWLLLATWLVSSVGLLALALYDLKWMILPSRIIYPTLLAAVVGLTAYIIFFEPKPVHAVFQWIFSLIIASGLFFVLFTVSNGKWIGYGDVRLGLITGTLLADAQKSLAMLFLASAIGSLVILPSLLAGKRNLASKLPFGPFLILATGIMVVFGDSLLNWYKDLFL